MNTCKRHRFPSDMISCAVWRYYRLNLCHRDIEGLLAERGIIVSREAVRLRCIKFGASSTRRLKRKQRGYGTERQAAFIRESLKGIPVSPRNRSSSQNRIYREYCMQLERLYDGFRKFREQYEDKKAQYSSALVVRPPLAALPTGRCWHKAAPGGLGYNSSRGLLFTLCGHKNDGYGEDLEFHNAVLSQNPTCCSSIQFVLDLPCTAG